MQLDMPLQTYAAMLQNTLNTAVSLELLLQPFKISAAGPRSVDLLVGHIIDDLYERLGADAIIDPIEVASSAWELGYDAAGDFLEHGPYLIYQLVMDSGDLTP